MVGCENNFEPNYFKAKSPKFPSLGNNLDSDFTFRVTGGVSRKGRDVIAKSLAIRIGRDPQGLYQGVKNGPGAKDGDTVFYPYGRDSPVSRDFWGSPTLTFLWNTGSLKKRCFLGTRLRNDGLVKSRHPGENRGPYFFK